MQYFLYRIIFLFLFVSRLLYPVKKQVLLGDSKFVLRDTCLTRSSAKNSSVFEIFVLVSILFQLLIIFFNGEFHVYGYHTLQIGEPVLPPLRPGYVVLTGCHLTVVVAPQEQNSLA
ncbi:hypothetical protein HanRHA438_Chr02g0052231 [Helianthus annuus]|nr:hypothetical protein HanRHA438_Chr02g0052231 [Helianthus annuus]